MSERGRPSLHQPLRRRLVGGAALAIGLRAVAQTAPTISDPQELLALSDAIRNPGQPFRVTLTLTEFEGGTQVNSTTLMSWARTLEVRGQFASLIRYVQPLRDAGKLMLKHGNELWFFDPATKSSVRIAPQQRLMGQASNGDVVTVNFARDYRAESATAESITDGERKPRNTNKLLLKSSGEDATYGSIELWLDSETQAPIKARFFAESGRLLKTAFYRKYQNQLGALRPTETVIIDGLDPKSVTLVRLSDYVAKSIPVQWFQRDYLPRFNAE